MRIVVVPSSGFGNRIRMIASCKILADLLGTELGVIWTPTSDCQLLFEDVFTTDNTFKKVTIEDVNTKKYYFRGHVHTSEILPVITQVLQDYEILLLEGGHEFKVPTMSIEEFIGRKQNFYQSLHFTNEIMNHVTTYMSRLGDRYIAVHYRDVIQKYDASDIANSAPNTISPVSFNQNSPIVAFYSVLDQVSDTIPILVVSNNQMVLPYIRGRLPSKQLFKTDFNVTSRSDRREMILSVVEFILMSRAKCIIGSYYSSFSDEASFYNQIPKIIPVTERLDRELAEKMAYHCYGFGVIKNQNNLYGLNLHNISQIQDLFTNTKS